MNIRNLYAILAITGCAFSATADILYKQNPVELWRVSFNLIGPGNGAFLSPHGDLLAVSAKNGMVRAYDLSKSGPPQVLWTFVPDNVNGASIRSKSGVNFFSKNSETFLTFSVIDDLSRGNTTSRIFVLAMDGSIILQSMGLTGEIRGTPQVSSDGRYIATTHNFNQTGWFSLIDTNLYNNDSLPLSPIFQYKSALMSGNKTTPFSELGFFARPDEGFYVDPTNNGLFNNNDLFLWMSDTNTNVPSGQDPVAGDGQMYVFQFPPNYDHSGLNLTVVLVGSTRAYQSSTRPIITNRGRTVYWSMVRGEIRGWVSWLLDRVQNALAQTGRGSPRYIAPLAPPTVSGGDNPLVCGPGSSNLVWKTSADLSNLQTVATDEILSNRVIVTPDNQFILYGTPGGTLTMTSARNLTAKVWEEGSYLDNIQFDSIQGEMALDSWGTTLYLTSNFGDITGYVIGLGIAVGPTSMPTISPSSSPVRLVTSALSVTPSQFPATLPTSQPSGMPLMMSSSSPPSSLAPTLKPTQTALLSSPSTKQPTRAPSSGFSNNKKTSDAFGQVVVVPHHCFWFVAAFAWVLAVMM